MFKPRRSTTLFKILDDEIISRALSYKNYIESIDFNSYLDADIVAMDETAVYYGNSNQQTIEFTGASSIRVSSTGYDSLRVTCVLGIKRNVEKISPLIISKGANPNITLKNGVWIIETQKAWNTQEAIRKWIEKMFPFYQGEIEGLC